jgi:hypothetical protein
VEKAVASVTRQSLKEMRGALEQLIFQPDGMEEMDKADVLDALGITLTTEELRRSMASSRGPDEAGEHNVLEVRREAPALAVPRRRRYDESVKYPVYGIFRNSKLATLIFDSVPLWLIAIHTVWKDNTRSMLLAIACDTFNLDGVTVLRWAGDTQEECFPTWSPRVFLAFAGLSLWTVGFILVLYVCIKRYQEELMEPRIMHRYGFFYRGFEPNFWWWELLHKRVDSAIILFVTYTGVVQDYKSKLIIFLACAGFNLALHEKFEPFEKGGGGLPGGFESVGLWVRFLTLLIFMLASLSPEEGWPGFATVITVVAVIMLLCFVACLWWAILSELLQNAFDDPINTSTGRNKRDFLARVGRTARYLLLRPLLLANEEKKMLEQEVPHLQWTGHEQPVQVVDYSRHGEKYRPWCLRRLFRFFLRRTYGLSNREQMALAARSMGQAVEAWLAPHLGSGPGRGLPGGGFVDVLAVLALALQRVGNHFGHYTHLGSEELVALLKVNVDAVTVEAWQENAAAAAGVLGNGDLTTGVAAASVERSGSLGAFLRRRRQRQPVAEPPEEGSRGPCPDLIRHAFTPEELHMAVQVLSGLDPDVARGLVRYILDRLGAHDSSEASVASRAQERAAVAGPAGLRAAASVAARREGDLDGAGSSRLEVLEPDPPETETADITMLMFSGLGLLKGERSSRPEDTDDGMDAERRVRIRV